MSRQGRAAARGVLSSHRAAMRDRRSLRKTDLIHTPQRSPPTNKLCQYTPHGFATDLQSRTAVHNVWQGGVLALLRGESGYGGRTAISWRTWRTIAESSFSITSPPLHTRALLFR
jgi:hypothetical protein